MFCPNCGSKIPDGSAFCTQCGKAIGNAPKPQQETRSPLMGTMGNMSTGQVPTVPPSPVPPTPVSPAPAPAPSYAGPRPGYMPVSLTPPQRGIKMTAGSTIFLVTVILFSVSTLLSLISGLVAASDAYRYTGLMVVMTLIGATPGVLLAIGMWMAFGSARQPDDRMRGVGLCRGIMITFAVLICIAMAVLFISIIVGLAQADRAASYYGGSLSDVFNAIGSSREARAGSAVVIIFTLILIAVMVLFLVYFLKLAKLCKQVNETMMTGTNRVGGTGFVFGMTIVILVFEIIGFLIMLIGGVAISEVMDEVSVVLPSLGSGIAMTIISMLITIAMYIFAVMTLSRFKTNMLSAPGNGYYEPPRAY